MLMMAQEIDVHGVLADDKAGRPWRCASGRHVLGSVRRENNARQLHLLDGHVITGSAQVWCVFCEAHREWHAGQDAIDQIVQRRARYRGI